jgi:hypothetical protein
MIKVGQVRLTESPGAEKVPIHRQLAADRRAAVDGSLIDGLLDEAEKQYANLEACWSKPHVLDDCTVHRVTKVYSDQAEDLLLYEEQLSRWKSLNLDTPQRQEVDRLAAQVPTIRERITAILALAEELKKGTIETVLAKSDFEIGMEFLLGKRKP